MIKKTFHDHIKIIDTFSFRIDLFTGLKNHLVRRLNNLIDLLLVQGLENRELDHERIELRNLPLEIHVLQSNNLTVNLLLELLVLLVFKLPLLLEGFQILLLVDKPSTYGLTKVIWIFSSFRRSASHQLLMFMRAITLRRKLVKNAPTVRHEPSRLLGCHRLPIRQWPRCG